MNQSTMNTQHRGELHALGERAEDQAAGDRRERRLERDEHELRESTTPLRNVAAIANSPFAGVERALEEQPVEAAEERVALGEREAVAVDAPQHRDQREHDEHLHQHRQHVLRAHHAAVEQRQRRHAHHETSAVEISIHATSPLFGVGARLRSALRGRGCRRGALRPALSPRRSPRGLVLRERRRRRSRERDSTARGCKSVFSSCFSLRALPRRFRRCGCG